jgi:hypothetical protein
MPLWGHRPRSWSADGQRWRSSPRPPSVCHLSLPQRRLPMIYVFTFYHLGLTRSELRVPARWCRVSAVCGKIAQSVSVVDTHRSHCALVHRRQDVRIIDLALAFVDRKREASASADRLGIVEAQPTAGPLRVLPVQTQRLSVVAAMTITWTMGVTGHATGASRRPPLRSVLRDAGPSSCSLPSVGQNRVVCVSSSQRTASRRARLTSDVLPDLFLQKVSG